LALDDVTVAFGGLRAVDGVSMTVHRGDRWAVIGPNGAGKTTLFGAISGEVRPTTGRVELLGKDVTKKPPYRRAHRGLGRTYQITDVFSELTVEENIAIAAMGGSLTRFRSWWPLRLKGEMEERVTNALDQVALRGRRGRPASELAHGEQRQLELAMGLATRPRLLLLDEPGAGLSSSEREVMRQLIKGLGDELTLVLIEHDMGLALELVQRVLCLDNGATVATGSPDEIRDNEDVQAVYLRAD
jgi:branched-chain amino acid transport system ATP-binding protein